MRDFVHQTNPGRVVFGCGTRHRLADEVDRAGLRRVLVVSTPGGLRLATDLSAPLGNRLGALHPRAVMHVPGDVAAETVGRARELRVDGCVAIGGGSSIGLAKIVAKETGLPIIAVPTTYAGSEMTAVWGQTDDGRKVTGRDVRVLPRVVVYDPELTATLPLPLSVTSSFNAIAHAAEALYASDRSPVTALGAAESVRALVSALPTIARDPRDIVARSELLYGSWLAGAAMGSTTMSLHHELCHVLGGTFDLPHSDVHTALLPHVLAYNLPVADEANRLLRSAVGDRDPAVRLFDLAKSLGAEMGLARLGMPTDGAESVVDQLLTATFSNPRPVSEDDLRAILADAMAGVPPRRTG